MDILTTILLLSLPVLIFFYYRNKKRNSTENKQKKENSKTWERMWKQYSNKASFFQFRMKRFGMGSYLSDIKKKYKNDMSLWTDYNNYLKQETQQENQRDKINDDLYTLKNRITRDFNSNSYTDKIFTKTDYYGSTEVTYTFENGDKVSMKDKTLVYTTSSNVNTYTLGLFIKDQFVKLFNSIIDTLNRISTKRPNNKPSYNHPKRGLYNTLKDTVNRREDQLRSGKYKADNKASLENELDNAKRKLRKVKEKYNF